MEGRKVLGEPFHHLQIQPSPALISHHQPSTLSVKKFIHSMSPSASATELNDIWTSIQSQKAQEPKAGADEPYVHPLLKRSSSLMSQKSLETCTESLGSETGSDGYFSDSDPIRRPPADADVQEQEIFPVSYKDEDDEYEYNGRNYYNSRSPPRRSFPPLLHSLSSRGDRPCLQMRPRREDGRLVVEAVAVPSQNYLHAERLDGRLLLSFVNTAAPAGPADDFTQETEDYEEDEEEEEVEVVDRGTVVEVKVSTQPQQHGGGAKVHRSSIVINKFVSCTPASIGCDKDDNHVDSRIVGPRRSTTSSTTAAAAAVAASTLGAYAGEGGRLHDNDKMLFTTKRRNREELLRDMRRCSQLRKPLFIREPCCIATSSS